MKQPNVIVIVIIILFGANIFAWIAVFELAKPPFLEVTFFDVGQGDAIFIETPQRHQILVDGGPDGTVLEKLGKEMPFWDRTIDLLILTHPEHDHMAGLIEVLKRYKVENVLWTGVVRDTAEYQKWLGLLEKEGAQIWFARAGQRITCSVCRRGLWEFSVLFPTENMIGEKKTRGSNNTSIVSRLVMGETEILLTGDIEKSVERELVRNGVELEADVLKVAHHGSKTSSIPEFISAVSPSLALISVGGDNRYGHPHPDVLRVFSERGIPIVRTDEGGDITFISDGVSYVRQY